MTDTPRRLLAYCVAVTLGAFTLALTIAVFMHIAPGLLVVFPLAAVWIAREMTWESEINHVLGV